MTRIVLLLSILFATSSALLGEEPAQQASRVARTKGLIAFWDFNLMKEYLQFIRHNYLWTKAIQKGKQDGSIKNQLPNMQIMQFMSFVTWGTINEVMRRHSPLERVGMDLDIFSTNVIRLLAHFLDNYQE